MPKRKNILWSKRNSAYYQRVAVLAREHYEHRRPAVCDPVRDPLADALWNVEHAASRVAQLLKEGS